jgi:phosphoribosylglycinamide formyltransferase-1
MSLRKRTAVLISGRGSNLQALVDACRDPSFPAEIVLAISNVDGAEGLARAEAAGIAAKFISHKDFVSREEFDAAIDASLRAADVSLVCEAGFMRIHSDWFANLWAGKLLNIHRCSRPFPGFACTARRSMRA